MTLVWADYYAPRVKITCEETDYSGRQGWLIDERTNNEHQKIILDDGLIIVVRDDCFEKVASPNYPYDEILERLKRIEQKLSPTGAIR